MVEKVEIKMKEIPRITGPIAELAAVQARARSEGRSINIGPVTARELYNQSMSSGGGGHWGGDSGWSPQSTPVASSVSGGTISLSQAQAMSSQNQARTQAEIQAQAQEQRRQAAIKQQQERIVTTSAFRNQTQNMNATSQRPTNPSLFTPAPQGFSQQFSSRLLAPARSTTLGEMIKAQEKKLPAGLVNKENALEGWTAVGVTREGGQIYSKTYQGSVYTLSSNQIAEEFAPTKLTPEQERYIKARKETSGGIFSVLDLPSSIGGAAGAVENVLPWPAGQVVGGAARSYPVALTAMMVPGYGVALAGREAYVTASSAGTFIDPLASLKTIGENVAKGVGNLPGFIGMHGMTVLPSAVGALAGGFLASQTVKAFEPKLVPGKPEVRTLSQTEIKKRFDMGEGRQGISGDVLTASDVRIPTQKVSRFGPVTIREEGPTIRTVAMGEGEISGILSPAQVSQVESATGMRLEGQGSLGQFRSGTTARVLTETAGSPREQFYAIQQEGVQVGLGKSTSAVGTARVQEIRPDIILTEQGARIDKIGSPLDSVFFQKGTEVLNIDTGSVKRSVSAIRSESFIDVPGVGERTTVGPFIFDRGAQPSLSPSISSRGLSSVFERVSGEKIKGFFPSPIPSQPTLTTQPGLLSGLAENAAFKSFMDISKAASAQRYEQFVAGGFLAAVSNQLRTSPNVLAASGIGGTSGAPFGSFPSGVTIPKAPEKNLFFSPNVPASFDFGIGQREGLLQNQKQGQGQSQSGLSSVFPMSGGRQQQPQPPRPDEVFKITQPQLRPQVPFMGGGQILQQVQPQIFKTEQARPPTTVYPVVFESPQLSFPRSSASLPSPLSGGLFNGVGRGRGARRTGGYVSSLSANILGVQPARRVPNPPLGFSGMEHRPRVVQQFVRIPHIKQTNILSVGRGQVAKKAKKAGGKSLFGSFKMFMPGGK